MRSGPALLDRWFGVRMTQIVACSGKVIPAAIKDARPREYCQEQRSRSISGNRAADHLPHAGKPRSAIACPVTAETDRPGSKRSATTPLRRAMPAWRPERAEGTAAITRSGRRSDAPGSPASARSPVRRETDQNDEHRTYASASDERH
jgi:hypothetical protein